MRFIFLASLFVHIAREGIIVQQTLYKVLQCDLLLITTLFGCACIRVILCYGRCYGLHLISGDMATLIIINVVEPHFIPGDELPFIWIVQNYNQYAEIKSHTLEYSVCSRGNHVIITMLIIQRYQYQISCVSGLRLEMMISYKRHNVVVSE